MTNQKAPFCSLVVALVAIASVSPATDVRAQDVDQVKALKVKAAFLYNFTKFIQWPDASSEEHKSPFLIGVLGDDPFGTILDETVQGKTISGHPIRIRRFRWSRSHDRAELTRCHGLFIGRSEQFRLAEILATLTGQPVLTVSDIPDFAQSGGSIGFVLTEGRIRFEMNRQALERARLKASSKLLKLARIVEAQKHEAANRK